MSTFKVIVAGSRDFDDYDFLKKRLDYLLQNKTDIEIVSGRAKGADQLGEKYAKENKYPVKIFPAFWNVHGKQAGYLRNIEMAEYGDACVVFWDGESKGTKHMIDIAKQKNLLLRICIYNK